MRVLCGMVLVALALAAAGCGDDDSGPTCSTDLLEGGDEVPDGLRVGLGGPGAGAFAPIASGDDVELDMGTQGGWMVQPVARIDDAIDASTCPRLVFTLLVDDLEVPGSYDLRTSFHQEDGAWISDPVQLFISLDVEALDGRGASLSASVTDGDATASVQLDDLTLVNER
ncbi:MAG TPA: hypothetical protein VMZ28_13990 [Kofleriaceae bacterium]|nr:hypothetical protein [Kofleriaceae bacterium]